ncbi:MAG: heme NO-binding domain-containing protein [Planctomycetota bacterium]|nr:heme NO-binding domain-containing protein [Planctomycetota bacterium]
MMNEAGSIGPLVVAQLSFPQRPMYGLVNKAIEGLVRQQFGDDAWARIKERAGWTGAQFVSMDSYDDEITYNLVGAASEELGLPPEQVLEAFGDYWTTYTMESGYRDTLGMMGDTLEEFLDNLDALHVRVGMSMPGLIPPSFSREKVADDEWLLHYTSERAGLAPMVIGLLKGLARRFEEDVELEALEGRGDVTATFRIRRLTRGADGD